MQRFKGVASGKQLFREHCATKWFLEANPRNISASKISRYTVCTSLQLAIEVVGVAEFSCACSVDLLAVKPCAAPKDKNKDKRQDRICSLHYMKWMMLQCTSMTGKEQTDN